jgi:glucose-6-phosphate 1-dehydrogenase
MSEHPTPAPIIVIFGITGDLSKRFLLPALYHLLRRGLIPESTRIIGTSRKKLDKKEFIGTVELCVLEKDKVCDPEGIKKVNDSLEIIQLDPGDLKDYHKLSHLVKAHDASDSKVHMFYMSVPSTAYEPIITHLAEAGLNQGKSRLMLEKPFGYDLESAKELVKLVNSCFSEEQIYRIDHYLAKETAQNLLTFRLHNPIFKPLWSAEHIERVHIKAFEAIGIEGRANFYEQMGALRDFVQSHLMQLLSIVMMDLPIDMSSNAIHTAKQNFFRTLEPADPKLAVRGQYDSYKEEVNNKDSVTETYAKVVLADNSQIWQGTEIILETGKAMDKKSTEVSVEFKSEHERRRDKLTFQIQPSEGISLDLVVKEPGIESNMKHEMMDFKYDHSFKDYEFIDAYERVLLDAISGDQSLFASDQEVIETWRVLQPVLEAWQASDAHLHIYKAGSKEVGKD